MSEWYSFLNCLSLGNATWDFKSSTNILPPVLLYYSGIFKITPEARHLLIVSQLNSKNTGSIQNRVMPHPSALDVKVSHDFSLIFETPEVQRDFLFHFQINGTDITAKQLAYTLIEAMTKASAAESSYLLDTKHRSFWAGLASNKLFQLKVSHRVWSDPESLP